MALFGLVYRDSLFPRTAYARAIEAMRAALHDRMACRLTVELLALGFVDSWDSRSGRAVIQGYLWGGGLGRHGSSGVER